MNNNAICCCGQLRIETEGEPLVHAVCHCSNCKKRTGSAFGVSAYFKDTQIINTVGKAHCYEIKNERHQKRYFCKNCGTTLYWKVSVLPGITGVAAGCFENPIPEPTHNLLNENACDWIELPETWKSEVTRRDFR